jgi:transcriptional regulator with XRE-family HTH domain
LSQEELSVLASLHRTEISQLERGLRMPQLDTLVKLAGGLEVAPEAFFEGIVWRPGRYAPGAFEVPDGEKGTA